MCDFKIKYINFILILRLQNSKISVKVYFHSNGTFLASSGRMGHKVYIREKIQTQLSIQNIERLQKDVIDPRAKSTNGHHQSCAKHNFDKCLYEKLTEIMKNATQDNCTAPWMANNTKICTRRNDINTTFLITRRRFTNQEYDCAPPCRSATVAIQGKNYRKYSKRTYGELYVYYGFEISKINERYYFYFTEFMAQFGGYVGLFLGYSLFDLVAFVHEAAGKILRKMRL